ncbi:MAG TPA: EAL domain-containing protein [Nocardioidaceae bacterium]|nr:EAL domain-containing protein [Nocardioidaceae bacterium]
MTSAATSGGHVDVTGAETGPVLEPAAAAAQSYWDSTDTLLAVLDADGGFTAGNPAWQRLLGWPESALRRTSLLELVHPADVGRVRAAMAALLQGPLPDLRARLRDSDGRHTTVCFSRTVVGEHSILAGQQATAAPERRLRGGTWQPALDAMPGRVAVLNSSGTVLAVNQAWRDLDTADTAHIRVGDSYLARCDAGRPDPYASRAAEGLRALLADHRDELSLDYPVGDRWFALHAARLRGNGPLRVVVSHVDVSERRRLEEAARTQAALLDELDAAVIAVDLDDRVTSWNRGAERLFGPVRGEALGAPMSALVERVPDEPGGRRTADDRAILPEVDESRVMLRRRDGTVLVAQVRNRPLVDDGGAQIGTLSVCWDVSAQLRAERDVLHARNYLAAVTDSMGEGLFALDSEGRVTVMNQAAEGLLGWTFGEIAGQTMHEVIHHRYPDGRVFPRAECPLERVHHHGETLRLVADVFVRRDGLDLPVTYTAAPLDTGEGVSGCVVVFIDATEVHAEQQRLAAELNQLAWVQRLRQVLDEELFELFAQPIARLDTGEVTQHELLLRVRRSDGTFAPPGEYLTTAEEHGLIGEVDRWVIQQALALAATGMHVELNVSASSIGDEELLHDIEQWLSTSSADPGLLVFEITETALIQDQRAGRAFVERLHELGCKVALDDFGTGYGGFTYLKQLPVHYLKIDIEFVRDLCDNQASRHVVQAVVNLANGFGLRTVAEGVEDQRTLELLRELGVDFAQGYHIGRPEPIEWTDETRGRP